MVGESLRLCVSFIDVRCALVPTLASLALEVLFPVLIMRVLLDVTCTHVFTQIVCNCLCLTKAELSRYNKDYMAYKAENIYSGSSQIE